MVELVQAGRKSSELAKEFNCHATSTLNWVRQSGGSVPLVVDANRRHFLQHLKFVDRHRPATLLRGDAVFPAGH